MPTYMITGPDGKKYKVTGEGTAEEALALVQSQAEPSPAFTPTWGDRARAVAAGATWNFNDELEAAIRAPFSVQTYRELRDQLRAREAQYAEAAPTEKLGLELGGAIVSGGGAFKGLTMIPRVAQMGRGAQLIATGALEGSLAGAGGADEMTGVPVAAATGGALGAVLGGAAHRVERLYPGVAQNQNIAAAVERGGGVTGLQNEVANLNLGARTPWARVAHVRPEMAQAALNVQPQGTDAFVQQMRQTQRGQPARVQDAMARHLGVTPQGRAESLAQLEAARRAHGNAQFSPLTGETVNPTADMVAMLETPLGQRAGREALNVIREQRRDPSLELADVIHEFDFWHAAQQVYGDFGRRRMASDQALSGPLAGSAFTRQREIIDNMESHPWGPQYQAAREAYRRNSQVIDALNSADEFAKLPADELRTTVRNMSPREREVYGMGIVQNISEMARRSPEAADQARNVIKSQAMRENLSTLLGASRAKRLIEELDRLSAGTQAYNRIFSGSKTASQLAMDDALASIDRNPNMLSNLLQGNWGSLARNALLPEGPTRPLLSQGTAQRLLNLASAGDSAAIAAALAELRRGSAARYSLLLPSVISATAQQIGQQNQ